MRSLLAQPTTISKHARRSHEPDENHENERQHAHNSEADRDVPVCVTMNLSVAGTVRVDCTVPDGDVTVSSVILRSVMLVSVASNPSTRHSTVKPLPVQWNRAFSPTSALTDTGSSVSAIA